MLQELLANEENTAVLARLAQQGRLPQAIVLEGPRGSGRLTLARRISALGVCRAQTPGCMECADCRLALQGIHSDVELYAKDGAGGTLTISSLRAINRGVATPPNQGRRRVVILRDVQDAAQARSLNTLLKVLEEPPEYLMFIITVDNRESLLATILSRCLLLRMALPDAQACAQRVCETLGEAVAQEDAYRYAVLSGGNVGRTCALCTQGLEQKAMNAALEAVSRLFERDTYGLLCLLQKYERDRSGYRLLLEDMKSVVGRVVREACLPQEQAVFASLAGKVTASQGVRLMEVLDGSAEQAQYNINLPLALTRLGARLSAALSE